MKIIAIITVQTLIIATVATVSYCVGSFYGTPILVNQDFDTKWCTEIIVTPNFYTKANDTVCERTLVDGTTLPKSPVAGTYQTNNIQGVPVK